MKKVLDNNLTLYFNNIFPKVYTFSSKKRYTVVVGLGGNIGDVSKRFKTLIKVWQKDSRVTLLQTSPLLKNPPFGYTFQDDFINSVVVLKTNLSAKEFLRFTQRYEKRFKRERSFKDAPRTLDIDIIFFDNYKIDTKELTIPHKEYKKRDSVMIPLKYIKRI